MPSLAEFTIGIRTYEDIHYIKAAFFGKIYVSLCQTKELQSVCVWGGRIKVKCLLWFLRDLSLVGFVYMGELFDLT